MTNTMYVARMFCLKFKYLLDSISPEHFGAKAAFD